MLIYQMVIVHDLMTDSGFNMNTSGDSRRMEYIMYYKTTGVVRTKTKTFFNY